MKKPVLIKSLIIISAVIALDQVTKYVADTFISPYYPVGLLPVLRLVNVRNTGAAFGMFSNLGNSFFIGVSLIAMVFITYMLIKGKDGYFCLSMILGGACGNLIDRFLLGYVRDFIDVYIYTYHWPAFNIADSALSVGLFVLILSSLSKHSETQRANQPGTEYQS
jgi:signal peptidase II